MELADSRSAGGERRLIRVLAGASALVVVKLVCTAAGAPAAVLYGLMTATLAALSVLAWRAAAVAPLGLRRALRLLACGATLWFAGSATWTGAYAIGGFGAEEPPSYWMLFDIAAYGFATAGAWVSVRKAIRFREAALDLSIVAAAGGAIAAAVIGRNLETGFGWQQLLAACLPLLGAAIMVLWGSVVLGHWQGLPLSCAVIGIGQGFITLGSLLFGYSMAQGVDSDDRWAGFLWYCGAVVSGVAVLLIIVGADRPIRLARRPREAVNPRALLVGVSLGLGIAVGVSAYGFAVEEQGAVAAGLAASVWIGLAMTLRAWGAMRRLERAVGRLDTTLKALEDAQDRLDAANEQLRTRNVELRTAETMFSELLRVVDERSDGALRALIERTGGEDVAPLLARYLDR